MSGADGGLKVGDEILSIDGRDPRTLSAQQIHEALEGDEGTPVKLTVLRQGQIERLTITRGPFRGSN